MALVSSRLAIAEALVALLQGVTNPSTGQPLYQIVKLGAVYDPGTSTSFAEVLDVQGQGGPAGSGGNQIGWRIDETITYPIVMYTGPYEIDSTAATASMLTIQDILIPTLRKHFQLPDASNPTNAVESLYSLLVHPADRSLPPIKFPNGHTYLPHYIYIAASQQYNVELVQN